MTRPGLRLLHTSDVHLGGGFRTPEEGRHHEHCLCPLVAIEEAADRHRPDALLVVGDLFDHQRVPDELVTTVHRRLAEIDALTIVINGNHDLHDDRSLYHRWIDQAGPSDAQPGLLFLDRLAGSTIEVLDGALALWGKAMDDHHRGFRPLHDVPPRPGGPDWWVVLGHGHYEPTDDGASIRSSPITPSDIAATGADYVALGHWHVRTDVSADGVTAWYSGAPHGPGASGSFNLIELDPGSETRVTAVDVRLPTVGCHPTDRQDLATSTPG